MAQHTCGECGRDDFRTASGLSSHRRAKHPPKTDGAVLAATDRAVKAATHLQMDGVDAGMVAVLRDLARTIDGMGLRDAEAPMDNVTIPTYLKYATEMGLTPLSRLKLDRTEGKSGSKLAQLRSIQGGRGA